MRRLFYWKLKQREIQLGERTILMGVLNVTPDSFSDGARFLEHSRAIDHALRLLDEGADILDVGGESTRPGAQTVDEHDELQRVLPVLEALAPVCDARGVPLSIDTRKPAIMRAALEAGATMVNDVTALGAPHALDVVKATDAGVCLMHMQGEPPTMQLAPAYDDVVADVRDFLERRAEACIAAGIARERISIDPGFGFGKTLQHNVALLKSLPQLVALGYPVLVGLSRKNTLGTLSGRPVGDRLAPSIAAALAAVSRGAKIVRVHDVRETVDALRVWAVLG